MKLRKKAIAVVMAGVMAVSVMASSASASWSTWRTYQLNAGGTATYGPWTTLDLNENTLTRTTSTQPAAGVNRHARIESVGQTSSSNPQVRVQRMSGTTVMWTSSESAVSDNNHAMISGLIRDTGHVIRLQARSSWQTTGPIHATFRMNVEQLFT
jgi:hypothetical protein